MNDATIVPPHRRTATPAAAPVEAVAEPKASPKTNPYVVKGSDIWTSAGRQKDGSVVELTPAEARHFIKINRLAPYVPGEEHEG